jgi:hypothetical protein
MIFIFIFFFPFFFPTMIFFFFFGIVPTMNVECLNFYFFYVYKGFLDLDAFCLDMLIVPMDGEEQNERAVEKAGNLHMYMTFIYIIS